VLFGEPWEEGDLTDDENEPKTHLDVHHIHIEARSLAS
jgi:hypothetical protein